MPDTRTGQEPDLPPFLAAVTPCANNVRWISPSTGLLAALGGDPEAGCSAVNIAMVPFLTLAGGALIWLALRPQD